MTHGRLFQPNSELTDRSVDLNLNAIMSSTESERKLIIADVQLNKFSLKPPENPDTR